MQKEILCGRSYRKELYLGYRNGYNGCQVSSLWLQRMMKLILADWYEDREQLSFAKRLRTKRHLLSRSSGYNSCYVDGGRAKAYGDWFGCGYLFYTHYDG